MTEFFYPGTGEKTKLAVHGGLFALSAICVGYNLAAFFLRREAHLARNVAVYAALCAIELEHMDHHR